MIRERIAKKINQVEYVKKAVEEKADLSAFKEKPSLKIVIGIGVIIFSFIIGWPAVGFFGILALMLKEPLIAVIGAPLIYGISHVVFWIGLYLAGAYYTGVFLKWATRIAVEKFFTTDDDN